MDVSSSKDQKLDAFYNELRRKYPNTFTLATDLGKGHGSVHKLPRLENTGSLTSLGILPNSLNHGSRQRWSQDSFLSKVQLQKSQTQKEQKQEAGIIRPSAGSVIVQDKVLSVPSWNRDNYLGAQNRASFRLPTLRSQVEQNKLELKNRLNVSKRLDNAQEASPKTTLEKPPNASLNKTATSQDPLGVIVKEVLPNKPNHLMVDLSKTTDSCTSRNGGCISDSDSGVSVCTPIKIFRPKIFDHQDHPDLKDIMHKWSAKPKTTSGPMKADHMALPENTTQIVNLGKSPVKSNSKTSINFNEKMPHRSPKDRVRFEDESEQDAETRFQERRILQRMYTTKGITNISSGSQIQSMGWNSKTESREKSPSPSIGEKPPTANQQTAAPPYRRQPFPPNVAKKVLIDIPCGGLPSRRAVHIRRHPAMRDITNRQMSPSTGLGDTSLDGITVSCTSNIQKWTEENHHISESREETKSSQSLSSLQTLESGITEVSSKVTIMRMESGSSLSSIVSENPSRSSVGSHELNLKHPSLVKGANISFYSKVKRSLHVKVKVSTDNRQENAAVHGKASPWGTTSPSPPSQHVRNEGVPGEVNGERGKMDVTPGDETGSTDRTVTVKAPLFSMRMMQSLLKKKRAKDYLVRVPSPIPSDPRPQSGQPVISRSREFNREPVTEHESARLRSVQSESCRGLYLAKRN